MKKYSKQRELILNSLQNRCDHPTVDMLYMDLKKEMPNIGIATIYRNLIDLQQEKVITKIKSEDGPDRFDGNIKPHIHLLCNNCKNIYDIIIEEKLEKIYSQLSELAKENGGTMEQMQITITGKCKDCSK